MTSNVNTPSRAYVSMKELWDMIDDLMGGTSAMRAASVRWLPKAASEDQLSYEARVNKTFLFNGLARCVKTLVGKPFSEDVAISSDIEEEQRTWLHDIDKRGNDQSVFARECFTIGLTKGLVHILCDYPPVNGRITFAEKDQNDIRPYLVAIDPKDLLGWQYVMENGRPVLSQIRIREDCVVPDGEWGEKFSRRVRVFDRVISNGQGVVSFRLFEEKPEPLNNQQTRWVVVEQGLTTTKYIPLTTAYFGERTGFMSAKPPLENLAWLNVEHWQSSSDQRHILHVARVPIWFLKGFQPVLDSEGKPEGKITIGPDRMIRVSSSEADLKIVEHSGAAIEAGRNDLMDIEARMSIMGAELLKKKSKAETTATEESHDNKAEDSDLSAMVKALEDALTTAIHFMYEWEGVEPPNGKLLTINTDFGITAQDAADLQSLLESRLKGEISHRTYLHELQRRGVLAPSVDLEKELTDAKADGPFVDPVAKLKTGPTPEPSLQAKAGAGS